MAPSADPRYPPVAVSASPDRGSLVLWHVGLPLAPSFLVLQLAALPADLLGCGPRGALAGVVVLAATLGALATVLLALRARLRGRPETTWWLLSTLVLVLPAALLFALD
jgi:hypothetical protein